ncbi:MAG: hypothetical protein M3N08_07040 [Pseudomonadota bacterium]|nr:hypothetical protein [Pseudomonadota bacterium]
MKDIAQYAPEAELLLNVAERSFVPNLKKHSKDVVHLLFRSMFLVDRHVDALTDEAKGPAVKNVQSFLRGSGQAFAVADNEALRLALMELKAELDAAPPTRRAAFLESVSDVFKWGKVLGATKDSREFIKARTREAVATANMVLTLVEELGRNQKFSDFLREVTIAENLLDSIKDAGEDKRHGDIAIKPVQVYFRLGVGTVQHAAAAAQLHPDKVGFLTTGFKWMWQHAKSGIGVAEPMEMNVSPARRPELSPDFMAGQPAAKR